MNVKLLRKVQRHILAEPRRLNMGYLAKHQEGPGAPACQTVGCIAGWASILGSRKVEWPADEEGDVLVEGTNELWTLGRHKLRLTEGQTKRLFTEPGQEDNAAGLLGWPERLSQAYQKAKSAAARAKVTAKRIDLFIKSGGRQ
jgi:hypothetical protein